MSVPRLIPWSQWVFAKPTVFVVLTSYLTLIIICGEIDASFMEKGSPYQRSKEDTRDLGSLLSLGLHPKGSGAEIYPVETQLQLSNAKYAQSGFQLDSSTLAHAQGGINLRHKSSGKVQVASTSDLTGGRYERDSDKHDATSREEEKLHGHARADIQQLMAANLGDGWLRDLGILDDHRTLLENVIPKLRDQMGPNYVTREALGKKLDHAIKLALLYIGILAHPPNDRPLFSNHVVLAQAQKAAFESWTYLLKELDLRVAKLVPNVDKIQKHKSHLAKQFWSNCRNSGNLNAMAWTLVSYWVAHLQPELQDRLGFLIGHFHRKIKTRVLDVAIEKANEAGIKIDVKDNVKLSSREAT